MKRRNAEVGKMRRPMKRNKITEGFYGSTLLYLKFLVLWALVILADFILEFRFEFLWPFYLLLRSVYDSFKYQGLAFSVFFVCIALTSDMLCFFFIPVHWLFFVASTYVWVQYVWHTDKGICAPTIVLWMLFVYLEAAVRLRDVKHMPGLLDLCRPFAAHCIGYPVVTLGFGFKSYVGFRIRQRKQRDVAKENEFYLQLMQQALPVDTSTTTTAATATTVASNATAAAAAVTATAVANATTAPATTLTSATALHVSHDSSASPSPHHPVTPTAAAAGAASNYNNNNSTSISSSSSSNKQTGKQQQHNERNGHLPNGGLPNGVQKSHRKANAAAAAAAAEKTSRDVEHSSRNGAAIGAGAEEAQQTMQEAPEPVRQPSSTSRRKEKKEQDKERENAEYLQRLESDSKRLRIDLTNSRASEQELRLQVASLTTIEKVSRGELLAIQREVDELQSKLQSCNSIKAQDKQTIGNLERRITEERRARTFAESQLQQERKTRKHEEVRAAQVAAQNVRGECTDACRQRRRDLEGEMSNLKTNQVWNEERIALLERENGNLSDQLRDTERLVSALNAMQERNVHLENSLSAETRIKLDLFSALGEAKRQLEIKESCLKAQEKEIKELKSKIAQVLAVMPNDTFGSPTPSSTISRVRLAESPPGSTLDPNATAYTPKGSLVAASTEA